MQRRAFFPCLSFYGAKFGFLNPRQCLLTLLGFLVYVLVLNIRFKLFLLFKSKHSRYNCLIFPVVVNEDYIDVSPVFWAFHVISSCFGSNA